MFPRQPGGWPVQSDPVERVVGHAPLAAIREVLSISIHDVVNEPRLKRLVADFYRISRWMDNEMWLRRSLSTSDGPRQTSRGPR